MYKIYIVDNILFMMTSKPMVFGGIVFLVLLAALSTAANYPAPFIQDGHVSIAVVYGSDAQASDILAVTDMVTHLQTYLSGGETLGSVSVKDSEVSSVSDKNLIVVGGSCVNTVSAQLLGVNYPSCGVDFNRATGIGSNQFLIQTFAESGGRVATLVAGYNAQDTTNAVAYLADHGADIDTTIGNKYMGASSTSANLVTGTDTQTRLNSTCRCFENGQYVDCHCPGARP